LAAGTLVRGDDVEVQVDVERSPAAPAPARPPRPLARRRRGSGCRARRDPGRGRRPAGCTCGCGPDARASTIACSPRPASIASGMPQRKPEGVISEVLKSPWASSQTRCKSTPRAGGPPLGRGPPTSRRPAPDAAQAAQRHLLRETDRSHYHRLREPIVAASPKTQSDSGAGLLVAAEAGGGARAG
jgi:hypothetical protein